MPLNIFYIKLIRWLPRKPADLDQHCFLVNLGSAGQGFKIQQILRVNIGLVARKSVFGVSPKASFKPVSSATEISWKIEISTVASLHTMPFKKRITKALIRLRGCAGWSAPVLFANPRRQVFLRQGPYDGRLIFLTEQQ